MGKTSEIQWTESTWNPHYGCHKITTGCRNCYMFRDMAKYGRDGNVVVKSKTKFNDPLKWKEPRLIFTCSWSDFFIEEADEWRDEMWEIIKATPQHTYQILTKRPERILQCLPDDWGLGYENVWLGVTVENQAALYRCEILGAIPSRTRFISAEPLLEEVDFTAVFDRYRFDWCIVGGESGNNTGRFRFRACEVQWVKDIITCCHTYNVAAFVKQLGTHLALQYDLDDRHGGDCNEWHESLRIREFPRSYERKKKAISERRMS